MFGYSLEAVDCTFVLRNGWLKKASVEEDRKNRKYRMMEFLKPEFINPKRKKTERLTMVLHLT